LWYVKAAEQGLPSAEFMLAYAFDLGDGVRQDDAKAAAWYLKAAEHGVEGAQHNLALMYETGQGINQDYKEAAKWNVAKEVISERLTDAMCQDGRIQVWRPPAGCWTIKPGRPFVSALAHMAKNYNWRFLRFQESDIDPTSQDSTSAFCSELVVVMLKQWKVLPKSARHSSKTLPVHLQQLQQLQWTDVTNEWRDVFREIREWTESSDLKACKNAGLSLNQGNVQIALLSALKTVQLNVRRR
jgi:hypothetical protein